MNKYYSYNIGIISILIILIILLSYKKRNDRLLLKTKTIYVDNNKNAFIGKTIKNEYVVISQSNVLTPFNSIYSFLFNKRNKLLVKINNKKKLYNVDDFPFVDHRKRLIYKWANGPEDIRLISLQNKHYIFCTGLCEKGINSRVLLIILNKNYKFLEKHLLYLDNKPLQRVEKNWTPFIYDNSIYISYIINPHEVYKLHPNGMCSLISKTNFNQNLPKLSGGSPAIFTEKGYLAIGHTYSKLKFSYLRDFVGSFLNKPNSSRVYKSYFYIFEKHPPFNLISVSKPITFTNSSIEFVTNIKRENNYLYITVGVEDYKTKLVVINFSDVWSFF